MNLGWCVSSKAGEASVPRLLPFKLGLILFCHKRLAGLPLTAHEWGEKVDPPNTGCVMRRNTAGSGVRQCLTFTSRALACTEEKKKKNKNASFFPASCYWRWLQPCAARPTLPSLTTALCNSAEMFQGAPAGSLNLGHMHVGSLGLRACRFHVCLPSTCHRDLLLLFTCTSAAHTLIPLPDERVTQS